MSTKGWAGAPKRPTLSRLFLLLLQLPTLLAPFPISFLTSPPLTMATNITFHPGGERDISFIACTSSAIVLGLTNSNRFSQPSPLMSVPSSSARREPPSGSLVSLPLERWATLHACLSPADGCY